MNRLSPQSNMQTADEDIGSSQKGKSSALEPSANLPKLNFPAKLHLILSTPEFNDIICWLPHGRAWRVQQQDKLETEILPKFFQHQKAASFYRQVTGWGFHRVISGTDFNAYFHELFLRDAPDLCRKMKRPTRTELSERKQGLPKAPPDFYVMPPVTEETADPTFTSEHKMTLEEHKDMLVRRLSTYSMTEKGMYLQMELNKLDKKKNDILKQLKGMGASTLPSATSNTSSSSSSSHQPTMSNSTTSTQHQLQASTNTATIPPPNLDILNNLQPNAIAPAIASLNPYQSLLNNNNQGAGASSALDQLRLDLIQQLQQPSLIQRPPDALSQLALANLLLGPAFNGLDDFNNRQG